MNELDLSILNQTTLMPSKINLKDLEKIDGFSWAIQLALIDLFCRYIKPINALEIGTWHGRSSVIMASYVNENNGLYWGIEPEQTRAQITEDNCNKVCPNGIINIERNISNYSELWNKNIPLFDIVHIDGEHSYNAVYHDLDLVKKLLLKEGLIILDDFFFDLYPQITQAVYKWLDDNPDYVLLAVGACKGMICNKMHYKNYADFMLSDDFIPELKKYDIEYNKISVTRTSPIIDCPTLGITTNVSTCNFIGNECGDGRIEKISLK